MESSGNHKPDLPEFLSLIGTNLQVAQVPLVAVLDNGEVTLIKEESYPSKAESIVGYYNPTFKFQFREGSKMPLVGIKQILFGEIKQYDNSSQVLQSSYSFKDIKFGEDTVFQLENEGFTYMIVEAQFAGNVSGIYATAFENTHSFGDSRETSYRDLLKERNDSIGQKVLDSFPVEITPGDSFLLVAQSVICHITTSYGFQVCAIESNKL